MSARCYVKSIKSELANQRSTSEEDKGAWRNWSWICGNYCCADMTKWKKAPHQGVPLQCGVSGPLYALILPKHRSRVLSASGCIGTHSPLIFSFTTTITLAATQQSQKTPF